MRVDCALGWWVNVVGWVVCFFWWFVGLCFVLVWFCCLLGRGVWLSLLRCLGLYVLVVLFLLCGWVFWLCGLCSGRFVSVVLGLVVFVWQMFVCLDCGWFCLCLWCVGAGVCCLKSVWFFFCCLLCGFFVFRFLGVWSVVVGVPFFVGLFWFGLLCVVGVCWVCGVVLVWFLWLVGVFCFCGRFGFGFWFVLDLCLRLFLLVVCVGFLWWACEGFCGLFLPFSGFPVGVFFW